MNFIQKALKMAQSGFSYGGFSGGYGFNDPYGGYYRTLPGSNFDYRREAGILWENSIIAACLNWTITAFDEAPLIVERLNSAGAWEPDGANHDAIELVMAPNPNYGGETLWAGTILSRMVDGNGFWYLNRSYSKKPVEIHYIPHFQISPKWKGSNDYISFYEYRVSGTTAINFKVEDVLHFRHGVDPLNMRRGLSPVASVLREVCSDNEASTAAAALMRNYGIVGLAFSPSDGVQITDQTREKMMELGKQKWTGERRGEPMVFTQPMKVDQLGFSPDQLALDVIRRIPEERITAVLGLPAVVVGMGAGLDKATMANVEQLRRAAYQSYMVPIWGSIGKQLSKVLLPEFGEDPSKCRLAFDTREVASLQLDKTVESKRIETLYRSGIIDRYQAKTDLGLQAEETDRNIFYSGPKMASDPTTVPEQL